MDGSTMEGLVQTWTSPRDADHPHQMWLRASACNPAANFAAFKAARSAISDKMCWKVYQLHDSAQYHFITMLLWDRPHKGYMSIPKAYTKAYTHHLEVT